MPDTLITMQITEQIAKRFTTSTPLLFVGGEESIKLEIKPYLQPFERELALRELKALLNNEDIIVEEHGYYFVETNKPEEIFRERLTYWQRVGRTFLEPTVQKLLEFTQNGLSSVQEKADLHNTRRLRYGPHGLHEYRGKFFPQLVRSLINISGVAEGSLVLDPMCGSGTTSCEAMASGMSAIGVDLNPLSVLIATVKSFVVLENPATFFSKVSNLLERLDFKDVCPDKIWSREDLDYLHRWFDPMAISDLAAVLCAIRKIKEPLYLNFLLVCLSNIIRSVSWQKNTDLRVRKEIKSYDPGMVFDRFRSEANKQLYRIHPFLSMLQRKNLQSSLCIRQGNAVNIAEMFPKYRGEVDLLITSPPYATALPYLDTDRLSLIVLGLLSRKQHRGTEAMMVGTREVTEKQRSEAWDYYLGRKHELPQRVTTLIGKIAASNHKSGVGFRRRNLPALLGKYFLDMLDAMRSAQLLMSPKAHGYYVVGTNSTILEGQRTEIPTDRFLFEIGAAAGWSPKEMISMELLASRDIFKENRGSAETILCFTA